MQITTQRARPASPAYDSYERRKNRTENSFVEGRMEGSRHCFSLASWGDVRKKDQKQTGRLSIARGRES